MGCATSADTGVLKVLPTNVLPAASPTDTCGNRSDAPAVDSLECLFPKSQTSIKGVRTTLDSPLNPQEALAELRKGNKRFLSGEMYHGTFTDSIRKSLAADGQSPMAAVIGCSDSRVPVEVIFDAQPGDLFILRNAGNTCMCAEGSIVGSTEYCIGHLRTPLILVMGHTQCGALGSATQLACRPCLDPDEIVSQPSEASTHTMLQSLLTSLESPVKEAAQMLPQTASLDEIAALAIRCNVFHTMKSILKYSDLLKDRLTEGSVQIHGAIYDITSGMVEFLGPLPESPDYSCRAAGA